MTDRLRVQTLHGAGRTLRQIAGQVGISVRAVQRIIKEPPVTDPACGPTPASRAIGRPGKAAAFRPTVEQMLSAEPSLPTVEVLSRLRNAGYPGRKSAVYELVKALRPHRPHPLLVRFEGLPGEFSQHDFGQVKVTYADGSAETVHFFASRLKFSRWSHVAVVPDEKVESLVRALLLAFESFGGVPLQAVFDNPKTVVVSRAGGRAEWNPTFAQAALDYGFGVELCTPRQPQQKGSAENLVGWVKNSFFKVRRFHDREDMLQQLAQWLDEVNTQRPSRATKEVPAARMPAERARLKPLAIPPADYALRIPVFVRATGLVEYGGIRYAMPPDTIGLPATLFLYLDHVRIVTCSDIAADHPRRPEVGDTCYRSEDRVSRLAAVCGTRGKCFLQRQEILELGPPAEALLTEWVHRPQYYWKQQVQELHALLVLFGPRRVLAAIEQAVAQRDFHVDAIAWLLDKKEAI